MVIGYAPDAARFSSSFDIKRAGRDEGCCEGWEAGTCRPYSSGPATTSWATYLPSKASFINPDTYRIAPRSTDLSVQADPLTKNRYPYGDPVNL